MHSALTVGLHECAPTAEELVHAYWSYVDDDPDKADECVREMLESLFFDGEDVESIAWEWEQTPEFRRSVGDRVVRMYIRAQQ